jgi:hypothetical protein
MKRFKTYEELDVWYEEQKQILLNQFVKELEEKKGTKEREQIYHNQMIKLHAQYEKSYVKFANQNKLKKGIDKLVSALGKIGNAPK